jgi:glycosyltransferase involved in cell wall biosynthesis
LPIFPPLFRAARAIVYNSVEERAMIEAASGNRDVPGEVVGVGSELPAHVDPEGFRSRYGLAGPFLLYVGRVDLNKGCPQLFDHFRRYRLRVPQAVQAMAQSLRRWGQCAPIVATIRQFSMGSIFSSTRLLHSGFYIFIIVQSLGAAPNNKTHKTWNSKNGHLSRSG